MPVSEHKVTEQDNAYSLGIDVGGTFSDILALHLNSGKTYRTKVPSTPEDPSTAILDGIRKIEDIIPHESPVFNFLNHGTTVATNTILEAKGAKVALIVTGKVIPLCKAQRLRDA